MLYDGDEKSSEDEEKERGKQKGGFKPRFEASDSSENRDGDTEGWDEERVKDLERRIHDLEARYANSVELMSKMQGEVDQLKRIRMKNENKCKEVDTDAR